MSTDFHRVLLASLTVSKGVDTRRRDYEDKRRDYQRASIAEYWIVDPEDRKITVLVLENSLSIECMVSLALDRMHQAS